MEQLERKPKQDVKDVRERFIDYIGNPLSGIKGYLGLLQEPSFPNNDTRPDKIRQIWQELFRRVGVFLTSGFKPKSKITPENLHKLLAYKDKDPLEPGVLEEFEALYRSIVEKPD